MEKTTPESLAEAYVWWLTPEETLRTPEKILRQILKMAKRALRRSKTMVE